MLYIVSTPIGNLQDVTIRAIRTLFFVDYILTEDVSKMRLLLNNLMTQYPTLITKNNHPKILQFNEFKENENLYEFLSLLKTSNVALASEAGTPLISDPGFKLVREAIKQGVNIVPIPGASALLSGLVDSGLPTDKFLFLGFLPKSKSKKAATLNSIKEMFSTAKDDKIGMTVILYESPHRLVETLQVLKKTFGDINIVLARELTKKFEEVIRSNIEDLLSKYSTQEPKGEFTLLFNLKNLNSTILKSTL